jgi:capsular exopolysaccharide synthesis family protein
MSRLYEALKEARRLHQGGDQDVGKNLWKAWGIDGIEIPSPQEPPEVREADLPALADGLNGASSREEVDGLEAVSSGAEVLQPSDGMTDMVGMPTKAALDKKARVIPHAVDPIVVEHYRRLRTKILQKQEEGPFRSLLVTSANPQEGKSLTVLNLGISFSMLPSFRVLVVDGDLRRGTLGKWLGVDAGQPGLSNLIDGSAQLEQVVLKSDDIPMFFMVRGNSSVPDMHASQLTEHMQKLAQRFDMILVDSPPVNLMADVQLLARSCDAVLLVARAFSTTRTALEKAAQNLLPFRLIGTVLNAGVPEGTKRYYHDYY